MARYVIQADISQFYPSIYTHTIPWAIHTKLVSKARKGDMNLCGNLIDREVRGSQDGQTKGVPIGPDTSLGISELLMAHIDQAILAQTQVTGGVRFIDDMEYGFWKLADAESALRILENVLYTFELQLNHAKTKIVELPVRADSEFATILRRNAPKSRWKSPAMWIDFFDDAFAFHRESPTSNALRYAVSCTRSFPCSVQTWEVVQGLLWQTIMFDPGGIGGVIRSLSENIAKGEDLQLDRELAVSILNNFVTYNAQVGHGSEVLWGIWAAIMFRLKLDDQLLEYIALMDDSFVAVATFVAFDHEVFSQQPVSELWTSWLEDNWYQSNQWLFVYEATCRGWFSGRDRVGEFGTNQCANFLSSNGVSFLDLEAINSHGLFATPRTEYGLELEY